MKTDQPFSPPALLPGFGVVKATKPAISPRKTGWRWLQITRGWKEELQLAFDNAFHVLFPEFILIATGEKIKSLVSMPEVFRNKLSQHNPALNSAQNEK